MKMKYKENQRVRISNDVIKCTPYDQHNNKIVIIESVNDFLGLYEVTLNGVKWALRENGFKKL